MIHQMMLEAATMAVLSAYRLIVFLAPWGTFAATVCFVFWTQAKENEQPRRSAMWAAFTALLGFFSIGGYFWFPALYKFFFPAQAITWAGFPRWHLGAHVGGIVAALLVFFLFARYLSPKGNAILRKLTRRNEAERNQRTDVRSIEQHLPTAQHQFDAAEHIPSDPARAGVFLGLDEGGRPLFIPYAAYKKAHIQVIGTTGFGKGVASTVLLAQSLRAGEAVFVLDPKNDEWAPSVLRQECERAGVPFHLIDLNADVPQLDFLAGMTPAQLEELFIAGFSLSEKGEAADFYRISDRKAAHNVAQASPRVETLYELFKSDEGQESAKYAEGFHSKFEELNRVTSILAGRGGLDLRDVIDGGGCVYFIGSMRNSKVVLVQRMMMVRLIQLAESRDRTQEVRQIAVFLDEFKYHISRPALEGLGAARDKGVHLILAHQSLADLKDTPADLDGDVVAGAVVENCSIRIAYRVQSPDTGEWLGKMSGEIQVDDEIRKVERNIALAEKFDSDRTVRQAARYLIDVNMFLNLPAGVAVLFGVKKPAFVHIRPIIAPKVPIQITPAPAAVLPSTEPPPLSMDALDLDQKQEPEPEPHNDQVESEAVPLDDDYIEEPNPTDALPEPEPDPEDPFNFPDFALETEPQTHDR